MPESKSSNPASKNELFYSKQERLAFVQAYKSLARNKQLTAEDALLRAVLMGKPLEKAFPSVVNEIKRLNGHVPHRALKKAAAALRSMAVNKAHLLLRIQREEQFAVDYPRKPLFKARVERVKELYARSLPITTRWGCNPEDELDFSKGLSMNTFKRVKEVLRGV